MKKSVFILIFLSAFFLTTQAQGIKYSLISGKILSEDGSPIKGMQIELRNYSAKEVTSHFFWEGRAKVDKIFADHTGKYVFTGLLEGDHYLSIEFPQKLEKAYEYIKKPTMPIKLNQGQKMKNADYTLKQIRTIMSGKIYKRNAVTPYANISLELSCNGKIHSSATTNENGEYVFVFEPAVGQWTITIKDTKKIIPSPLTMDLSKVNIFKNVNIISAK